MFMWNVYACCLLLSSSDKKHLMFVSFVQISLSKTFCKSWNVAAELEDKYNYLEMSTALLSPIYFTISNSLILIYTFSLSFVN